MSEKFKAQLDAFVDDYIRLLDRREYEKWLTLFEPECFYAVLREIEHVIGDNVLLVGENMKRLSGRVESGVTRDKRRMIHLIGWKLADAETRSAVVTFALWLDGRPSTSGRYEFEFGDDEGDALRIRKCTVILDTIDLYDTIYLPI